MKPRHITMVAGAFTLASLATIAIDHLTRPRLTELQRAKLRLLCAVKPDHPLCILLHADGG